MEKLSLSCARTVGIILVICTFSGFINNYTFIMYALIFGGTYLLSGLVANLKIKFVEKLDEEKRHMVYLSIFAFLDAVAFILGITLIAPNFGYFLAILIQLIWFVGKLIFYVRINE